MDVHTGLLAWKVVLVHGKRDVSTCWNNWEETWVVGKRCRMVRCMRAGWSREQLGVGLLEKLGHCRGGVGAAWAVGLSAGAYRKVRPWHLDQTGAMQGWCMVWKWQRASYEKGKPCGLVGEARA